MGWECDAMLDNIINGIFNFVTSDKFYLPVIL